MHDDLDELYSMFDVLKKDAVSAAELWHKNQDAFSKRTYVRTVFALVDGTTYFLLKFSSMFDHLNEISILSEQEIKIINGDKRCDACEAFKKSVKIFSKARGVKLEAPFDGHEWKIFQSAMQLRHSVTHPKSFGDLDITPEKMKDIDKAMEFFRDLTKKILD